MPTFRVVVSDQVFPSVETERELLAGIDAELMVADGTVNGVAKLAADADGILNTYLPVDAKLISQLRRCRVIARYGIGVDNVDVEAAAHAGIIVTNVPDYCVEEVAGHAIALILALIRRVPQADSQVREGRWELEGLRPIHRISNLAFGLVGFGRIARKVASVIEALGGHVLAHDPYVSPAPGIPPLVTLGELVEGSDVVSIHAPLTPDTRGLFDAALIGRMPRGAVLVNTSRGPLVELQDVVEALRSGHLGGAGLDVFDPEPVDPSTIAEVPNLLATPHMAYYSEESILESQRKAATQVIKILTGVPPDYAVRE
jgi:D-3-phosphoglycerate dehydrogenase